MATSVLAAAARRRDRHVGAVGGQRGALQELTHADCAATVAELSEELSRCGLRPRQIVGLCGPNSIEWLLCELALLRMGCIPCPIPDQWGQATAIMSEVQRYRLRHCLMVRGPQPSTLQRARRLQAVPHVECLEGVDGTRVSEPASPVDETFALAISSGTSGERKCLQMSWPGIVNTMRVTAKAWKLGRSDTILLFLPLPNMQQRTLCYTALWCGCNLTLTQPTTAFNALGRGDVTLIVAPPAFYEAALRMSEGSRDALCRLFGDRIRLMFVGSAPVPPRLLDRYRAAGLPLYQVYGMNEFGWIAFSGPGCENRESVGALVDGVSLDERWLPQIVVRGRAPQSHGYYVDGVTETSTVYVAPRTVATGDLGVVRSGRRVYLTGRRTNELITAAGRKIAPELLEREIEDGDPGIHKAFIYLRQDETALGCVVWIGGEASPSPTERCRSVIGVVNQSCPTHERVHSVIVRQAAEMTTTSGLLTEHGKPNRAAMLRVALASRDAVRIP